MLLTEAPMKSKYKSSQHYVIQVTIFWLSLSAHRVHSNAILSNQPCGIYTGEVKQTYMERHSNMLGKILVDYVVFKMKNFVRVYPRIQKPQLS